MRTLIRGLAGVLAIAGAVPAPAQQGGTASAAAQPGSTVGDYLCQFADKCDTSTAVDPVIASPPSSSGTRRPATRGFRLAGAAPEVSASPARVQPRAPMIVHRSGLGGRPAAGAQRRANLMLSFDYNSVTLTPGAQAQCTVFAQALMMPELQGKRFLIEGHTDARGARALNIDLSRRRARSVADCLIAHGVGANRVDVKGVGSDEPLPGQPATAEANRRVEAVMQ